MCIILNLLILVYKPDPENQYVFEKTEIASFLAIHDPHHRNHSKYQLWKDEFLFVYSMHKLIVGKQGFVERGILKP